MTFERLPDWIAEFDEASSFKNVCRLFEKAIEPLGIRYYGIGPLTGVPASSMFAAAEAPERWVDHYTKSGMADRDPLLRAGREGRSFRWGDIQPANDDERAAVDEVLSSGMVEGYATTFSGAGALKAGVTLSGAGVNDWTMLQQIHAKVLGDAMLQRALALNDAAWRAAMPYLSPVETRLLRLASEGNVDKEIGRTLNMPYMLVHERWRTIRRKLGAKDRANAVGIAVAIGLIPPPSQAIRIVFDHGQLN